MLGLRLRSSARKRKRNTPGAKRHGARSAGGLSAGRSKEEPSPWNKVPGPGSWPSLPCPAALHCHFHTGLQFDAFHDACGERVTVLSVHLSRASSIAWKRAREVQARVLCAMPGGASRSTWVVRSGAPTRGLSPCGGQASLLHADRPAQRLATGDRFTLMCLQHLTVKRKRLRPLRVAEPRAASPLSARIP